MRSFLGAAVAFAIVAGPWAVANAQEGKSADLAKSSQNPISDVTQLPFRTFVNFNTGLLDKTQTFTNIQPIIPVKLGGGWNLVTRPILPVIYQPALFKGDSTDFGIGDLDVSPFLVAPTIGTPTSGSWTVGIGPDLFAPTATDRRLGSGKWSAGPTGVVVYIHGNIVTGVLAKNEWSFTGESTRKDVNSFLAQPFFFYNLPDGWFIHSEPIITADWTAPANDRWFVPVGGGFGRLFKIGPQPINMRLEGYYNVERPTGFPDWTVATQLTFLFPN